MRDHSALGLWVRRFLLEYMVAERFTLVDLSIASFVPFMARSGVADLSGYPHIGRWTGHCTSRPDLAVAMAG